MRGYTVVVFNLLGYEEWLCFCSRGANPGIANLRLLTSGLPFQTIFSTCALAVVFALLQAPG